MSRISVWYVRAALLHFGLGASVGAWQLVVRSGMLDVGPLPLGRVHVEMVLLGWVCQLALGVALWILPFSRNVSKKRRFWAAWLALNGGIVLVVLSRLAEIPLGTTVGRGLEVSAGLIVVFGLWGRVRPIPQRTH